MTALTDTTDLLTGVVVAVSTRPVATALAEDVAAGATALTVVDNATILPGDVLRLTDPDDPETVETVAVDDLTGIDGISLATALVAGYPATTRVSREPAALETIASVSFDDDSEPLPVPVEHALGDALLRGIRDNGLGELVRIDRIGGELRIVDIIGRGPVVDGDFILTPGTGIPLGQTLQDIYDEANEIAAAAAEAAYTATVAQQTADGKNKVWYANTPPGDTPNQLGDIWFQRDGTPNGGIIAQWEGLGGTMWASRQLRSEVIANLDAGKITAGTAFINALQVLTNFTLGNATTDGVIQTYDFANQEVGVLISKSQGVVAKGALIAGSNIVGSAVYGGTVSVGTPGGTEIFLSTATDPLGAPGAWAIEDFRVAPGWNAGRLWATYNPDDAYLGTSSGILKASSPYTGAISRSAIMQLMSSGGGTTYATFDADNVELRSDRMIFASRDSSFFDVRLTNTSILQFINGNAKFGINFAATGSGNGALNLQSRVQGSEILRELQLSGAGLLFNSGDGTRNLSLGPNFASSQAPILIDATAGVGISFRGPNIGSTGGRLDVVGVFGNNWQNIAAWDFLYQSDESWKDAVEDAPAGMLEQVEALRPREYGVKDFDPETTRTRGLIAQEVAEAIPDSTYGGENNDMGIRSYVVITTLIGAVQELSAKVRELEAAAAA